MSPARRVRYAWVIFVAAVGIGAAVLAFFTKKVLDLERSLAVAQAEAALEENVRLALWRIDSTAALLMQKGPASAEAIENRVSIEPWQTQTGDRFEQKYQTALADKEFQQRQTLKEMAVLSTWDWRAIEGQLLERVKDLFPEARLEGVDEGSKAGMDARAGAGSGESADERPDPRRLATIPARLLVNAIDPEAVMVPWRTPTRVALVLAWCGGLLAAGSLGYVLWATLALSERRRAFASAVTHELRTPLTTFRMYAEMLASDMVADPEARREYLQTLLVEADRLSHMVENVLAYSRLEQSPSPRVLERITLIAILEQVRPALSRRAEQGGKRLEVRTEEDGGRRRAWDAIAEADPVAMQQILLNLVDNACKYGQEPITLEAAATETQVLFSVRDGGRGLGARAGSAFEPFNKKKGDAQPGIGLGLYIARQLARNMGGDLTYEASTESRGSGFTLRMWRR